MEFNALVGYIKNKLDVEQKNIVLYAYNATGKTRISIELSKDIEDFTLNALYFNAILEDFFIWDNENYVFKIEKNSWVFRQINDQGLDKDIVDTFKEITDSNIEPILDLENANIKFGILTGDSDTKRNIKISKGEEMLFKWAVFYTLLNNAIDELIEPIEKRSTDCYNKIKYIIIDDPVSSIDDYRIYTVAMQIIGIIHRINKINEKQPKLNIPILITTHHSLFYNILFNSLKNNNKKYEYLLLNKNEKFFEINPLKSNQPFSFHLYTIKQIKMAIDEKKVSKMYFNLFRSLLEKTSSFLGLSNWQELFNKFAEKDILLKVLNMNSHEKYSEIEPYFLQNEQISIMKNGFDWFIKEYKFIIQ